MILTFIVGAIGVVTTIAGYRFGRSHARPVYGNEQTTEETKEG